MQEVVERCSILVGKGRKMSEKVGQGRQRSEKVGKGRKVFQTNWTIKFIYTKMSIHMFLPVVFVFQSVVFVLEEEIDLLQQHMVI